MLNSNPAGGFMRRRHQQACDGWEDSSDMQSAWAMSTWWSVQRRLTGARKTTGRRSKQPVMRYVPRR